MLGTLTSKLIAGGVGFLILLSAFLWFRGVLHERAELREWQHSVLIETQNASNNPKLIARDVGKQIQNMGQALKDFRDTIAVQNGKVEEANKKSQDALAFAAQQAALRKEVIAQSQALTQQLRNEALTPVDKERLEAELRRVQDLAWEAGL